MARMRLARPRPAVGRLQAQVLDRGLCHAGGAVSIGVGERDLSRVLRAEHFEEEYGRMKENHVR